MGKFYLDRACEYIEQALSDKPNELDLYNLAVRFSLENKEVEKAEEYILKARDIAAGRELSREKISPQAIESDPEKVFERNNCEFFTSNLLEIKELNGNREREVWSV